MDYEALEELIDGKIASALSTLRLSISAQDERLSPEEKIDAALKEVVSWLWS